MPQLLLGINNCYCNDLDHKMKNTHVIQNVMSDKALAGPEVANNTHLRWLLSPIEAAATPLFSQHARRILPWGAVPHRNSQPRLLIHCMVLSRGSSGQPSSCIRTSASRLSVQFS